MRIVDGRTPLAEITWDDVQALIAGQAEEGPTLELKRELPANDQRGDLWTQGQDRFANPARDTIARELVAFANAYGGTLIVGIDETEDAPKRASGIGTAIREIAAFVERFEPSLRSVIDPPLPGLELRAVPSPDQPGFGVLILRVASSALAPHGFGRPPAAYVRRGAAAEPMTMRDIQGSFWEARTRSERIKEIREERREISARIEKRRVAGSLAARDNPQAALPGPVAFIAARFTAIPEQNLRIGGLVNSLTRPPHWTVPRVPNFAGAFGSPHLHWNAKAHAVWAETGGGDRYALWSAMDDGTFDLNGVRLCADVGRQYIGWYSAAAAQTLILADRLRRVAGGADIPLVLDCELRTLGGVRAMVNEYDGIEMGQEHLHSRIGPFLFGSRATFNQTFAELEAEIWHALGSEHVNPIQIDFPATIAALGF